MALYRVTVMPEPVTYTVEAPTEAHAIQLADEWFMERAWIHDVSEPLALANALIWYVQKTNKIAASVSNDM
jgi:hypothetical protein